MPESENEDVRDLTTCLRGSEHLQFLRYRSVCGAGDGALTFPGDLSLRNGAFGSLLSDERCRWSTEMR